MPIYAALDTATSFYHDGIPAPNPTTLSVAAAANDTLVLAAQGGDADSGYTTTWGGSGWTKFGDSQFGGNATAGYWNGSGNPPNGTITHAGANDRIGGAWASFKDFVGWDFAMLATGTNGPIAPPQLVASRRMTAYDLWVVITAHRDGTLSLPAGWTTAAYRNWKSRAGGIHYKVGAGERTYTPPTFSSVDTTTQVTLTIALYGTPPPGGSGFGTIMGATLLDRERPPRAPRERLWLPPGLLTPRPCVIPV